MKQNLAIEAIRSRTLSLSKNESFQINGFHPDLFLSLINCLNIRLLITVYDEGFELVYKHLSSFLDGLIELEEWC